MYFNIHVQISSKKLKIEIDKDQTISEHYIPIYQNIKEHIEKC